LAFGNADFGVSDSADLNTAETKESHPRGNRLALVNWVFHNVASQIIHLDLEIANQEQEEPF
jgi:hypothetical protein